MATKKRVPEIRFQGFSGEWEEKKVKEIFRVTRGQVLASSETSEIETDQKPYPVYSSQTKNSGLMGYYKDHLYENAITWTTDGANAGTVNYREGRFFCTNVCGVLLSEAGYANKMVSESLNKIAWKHVSRVGNPKLMNNVMGDIQIILPCKIHEQQKIGSFFQNLDAQITLHQRKLAKLGAVKKSMLEKMFPREGAAVPEIRFQGFKGDWERKTLGEMCEIFSGLTYSPSDVIKDGGTFVIRSSNVKNGELIDADDVYVKSDVVNAINVLVGDVIIVVRNGSRSLIGKHAQVKKIMENTVIGAFMTGIRFTQPDFLNALLDTYQFSNEIEKNLGATINQITIGSLTNMRFAFPKKEEQLKIGNFFSNLDSLITLQQRELDKLKNIKQACLAKMFV